jgi:hypothetical protein
LFFRQRAEEKSCERDYKYVSRQWIGLKAI